MPTLYRVGGYVRDRILGLESNDIDFTFVLDDVTKTVDEGFKEMTDWLVANEYQIFLSTPDMYTIRAKFPKTHKFAGTTADFVLARKEVGYVENSRRPILELGDLYDDLLRRDFTVNAMALDEDDNVIDPCGGIDDLQYLGVGILKTPLPAHVTMLDDPLRVLRAIRFSITKGFTISHEIIKSLKNPEILEKLERVVSSERIREELTKMMKHDTIKTIEMIVHFDTLLPGFAKIIFSNGLWLKPTFEKK